MFTYLPPELIGQIKQFFATANTPYNDELRSILLSGINYEFVGRLKNFSNDLFQLSGDLNSLNSIERLSDGTIPFETWLRNAIEQLSYIDQTKVLSRALDELTNRKSGAAPIVNPTNVPEIFEVKEASVHRDDMVAYSFLSAGRAAGESVARVQVQRHDNGAQTKLPGGQPEIHHGTGWLLAPDILMTNHHVINARKAGEPNASLTDLELQAKNTSVQFDFDADTMVGTLVAASGLEAFDVDLDYAILRLEKPAGRSPLSVSRDKIDASNDFYIAVNIIQHPNGGPKKVALRNNLVYDSKFPKVRYFTDTEHGSSGSPVFNDSWQVVALHRASSFVENVKFQGRLTGWVNEGTQLAAILEHLKLKNASIYEAITGEKTNA